MTTRPPTETLLLALDLGNTTWTLGFGRSGSAAAPRLRTMRARDLAQLRAELATAKQRVGLPPDAPVVSCYEAGRDGFWPHRALTALGVTSLVVDSSSIEVTRRARQAKSDRLDTTALLAKLARHVAGDRDVWSVVHVPSVEDEDRRQLQRTLDRRRGMARLSKTQEDPACLDLPPLRPVKAQDYDARRPAKGPTIVLDIDRGTRTIGREANRRESYDVWPGARGPVAGRTTARPRDENHLTSEWERSAQRNRSTRGA